MLKMAYSIIYKSGNKSSVKICRPISLLCIISKILERMVYDNIISFVSRHISSHQLGFRQNHSTFLFEFYIWATFLAVLASATNPASSQNPPQQ